MYTYQDLSKIQSENEKENFIIAAIRKWKSTSLYKNAVAAKQYYKGLNATILQFQKYVTKITGEQIPDIWSSNFKIPSNFFYRFTSQKVNFLLGNGVSWTDKSTADKLGTTQYTLDTQLKRAAEKACICGEAFGFYNLDHIDVFDLTEFVPLCDEEDGAIKAGIRFWQIADNKPLRATFYEIDGITQYIWINGECEILEAKRPYKQKIRTSEISGSEIYDGENYPTFPIVPLWGNSRHQSDIIGIREQIDCFDLTKSGFANTIDEASYIYWTLQNAGGMDDVDLAEFLKRLRELHTVVTDDAVTVTPNSVQAPFEAREILLKRLEQDLYRDAMALDIANISGGAATATEIKAAYEPLNMKADDFEYCIIEFLQKIMYIAGVMDNPTFTRSILVNVSEDIQTVLQAAAYLEPEYVTQKILQILGDGDKAQEIIAQMNAERLNTLTNEYKGKSIPEEENDAQSGTEGE